MTFAFPRLLLLSMLAALLAMVPTGQGALRAEIVFAPPRAEPSGDSLAPMIEKVLPGVVSIAVTGTREVDVNPLFSDPFFRRFFDFPGAETPPEQDFRSAGSGVVIDAESGLVLTNAHVIADADRITVRLGDGREFAAEVLGADSETDVAALSIAAEDLTALVVGHSDTLRVGDPIVALGNPFGLEQTVTSGIVSALGRSGLGIEGYESFIQVDAAINPGNSGGALVNLRGELVGINTAIVGPAGGNVGIGFAVPIDMAIAVAGQLVSEGEVRRGQIGVIVQALTPQLAEAMGLKGRTGALVADVMPESPAAAAGLRAGDVIVSLDGAPVRSGTALRTSLALVTPDTEVVLGVLRDGTEITLRATLAARPGSPAASAGAPEESAIPALAGVTLRPVPTGAGPDGTEPGVLVETVAPGSEADRSGLQQGDIILEVNMREVRTPADIASIAAETPEKRLLLRIFRHDSALFVVVG